MKTIKNYDNFLNEKKTPSYMRDEIPLGGNIPFPKSIKKETKYNCKFPDPNYRNECVDFDYLLGRTFVKVTDESGRIEFFEDNGNIYHLDHRQDCCEDVYIEDIDGDLNDLVGNPILRAEESSSEEGSVEGKDIDDNYYEWTFYKLATIKGSLTIRWFGSTDSCYATKAFLYVVKDNENN